MNINVVFKDVVENELLDGEIIHVEGGMFVIKAGNHRFYYVAYSDVRWVGTYEEYKFYEDGSNWE